MSKKGFYPGHSLILIGFLGVLSACAAFDRSPDSGYNAHMSPTAVKRSHVDGMGDQGQAIETKTRLKQLENTLQSKKEMEQYSRTLPFLRDDNEKIYFLSLAGYEARQKWLKDEDINSRAQQSVETYRELVEAQDIGLGMTQILVKKSWGEPESVESSGNPQFRNERWHYSKYVSTPDGYKLEKKRVYFEGGRVAGWEVE